MSASRCDLVEPFFELIEIAFAFGLSFRGVGGSILADSRLWRFDLEADA